MDKIENLLQSQNIEDCYLGLYILFEKEGTKWEDYLDKFISIRSQYCIGPHIVKYYDTWIITDSLDLDKLITIDSIYIQYKHKR